MNHRSNIDLLALIGAELVSVNKNGKKMNCVVVPVDWNCISVTANKDGIPNHAYLNMVEWETSDKFREACESRHSDEPDYIAPSHQISVSYTKEFSDAANKKAEETLRKDGVYMAENPSDDEVRKKAEYQVRNRARIGYVTPIKRKEPAAYTGTAPEPSGMSSYVPPVENEAPYNDLPF